MTALKIISLHKIHKIDFYCGQFYFNPKKTENSTSDNKKKFLLIKNQTPTQNRSNSKPRQPIIMLKKKSVDQSKSTKSHYESSNEAENESSTMSHDPTHPECSPHKIRKVSHSSSSAGGMSPDSGWGDSYSSDSSSDHAGGSSGHSDTNSSEPSSPVTYDIPQTPMTHHQHHAYANSPTDQSPSPSSPTQPEVKADMSNYIEQAFQFSMGMKPEVKKEVPEVKSEPMDTQQYSQPIESPEQPTQLPSRASYESSPTSSTSLTSDVFDIFGDVNVDISYSKTAPPWEELDIEIEPCFKNNISPFYFN